MLKQYPSTMALRQDYLDLGCKRDGSDSSWYNGETSAATLRKSEVGDTRLVPEAERYFNQLDQVIETPRREWERNVAGAFCCVPDVLAGLPTPMRRQVITKDDRAPITIFVCTTSSAGIDSKVLERRGTIILALVMALARVRPVSLHQMAILDGRRDGSGETILTSEINTHPLDLATACYVLTSAGFARDLTYNIMMKLNNAYGSWPRNFSYHNPQPFFENLKPRLVADPKKCLIIGAAQLGDELLRNPLEWINKQITYFTTQQEENQ